MFHAWAENSETHQAENSTPKSLLRMQEHPKLITQKARPLQDQPTQKKRSQSQRQNQHRNIRSAIQNFEHKKIQPGIPPIPNVSRFFSVVFYSNLNHIYKTLTSYLHRKIL